MEVIGHRVVPHSPPVVAKFAPARRIELKKGKSKTPEPEGTPPPVPPPAQPPLNWQELSRPKLRDLSPSVLLAAKPAAADDWALVRTKDGKAGWVLARMLSMAIPDEVAQYAEGHRITAYLPLGEVRDKERGEVKNNWLWTTVTGGLQPYEFDSFRVFVWSARRHHYETAFIEKNVKGYYPIESVDLPGKDEKGFSVIVEDKDGQVFKRTYGFSGYHVRMISKVAYAAPVEGTTRPQPKNEPAVAPPKTLWERAKARWAAIRGKS